jgi:predicted cupin superfamily sugar epimerase
MTQSAQSVIDALGLMPHPEGGHYKEIYRAPAEDGTRSAVTSIYYLLQAGERSAWHKVDAVEIWHFHAGDALLMGIREDENDLQSVTLGLDIKAGQQPQGIVPAHAWQSARPLGSWTLVGCTVAPGFDFAGFEMASPEAFPYL